MRASTDPFGPKRDALDGCELRDLFSHQSDSSRVRITRGSRKMQPAIHREHAEACLGFIVLKSRMTIVAMMEDQLSLERGCVDRLGEGTKPDAACFQSVDGVDQVQQRPTETIVSPSRT